MGNTAPAENGNNTMKKKSSGLFPVSPYMVIPSRVGGFALYLKQGEEFVLYAERGVLFTDEHRERLTKLDVKHVYIKAEDYAFYNTYLHDNLLELLDDEIIPVRERARAWNDATVSLAKDAFDKKLPATMDKRQFIRIRKLINSSLRFLAREDSLRELARFIADGSELYRHGIGVMVMTISVLSSYVKDDSDLMVAVGMGALLHDIGKLELPDHLFSRRGDSLSMDEQGLIRSHPALGVGVCSSLPLPQETLQCILFHHECNDGTGYPSGAQGDMLPSYVKVLSLCNEYDNLTRGLHGRKKLTPFEALTRIKNRRGCFDKEMLARLIAILSKAKLT
ncbi:HD domain-containing phosphohydrolase [Pseudodesulfovibrio sp. zrk46]|uniref:HD-GYP domain-containing protein n=1 Tax=Pseudodesulfovibrio sp. zrk46 TaxID=2725288 RepID=UPI00144A2962|nr:HD domain-containing phosphohydrolase [Pseudodesulfovibrio sp. zrk46]QJB56419.1 HD domain-containing protein [Pseudodesulfovibrio sp. zrk46]